MGFKEMVQKDLDVFFNQEEFSEIHLINGVQLPVVIDNDQLMKRSKVEYQGISVGQLLFYVKSSLIPEPSQGDPFTFDNKLMYVFDVREDCGMYEIILQQNRGGNV